MLSLEECRQILGKDCNLQDKELEDLRHDLYALAEITIDSFQEKQRAKKINSASPSL